MIPNILDFLKNVVQIIKIKWSSVLKRYILKTNSSKITFSVSYFNFHAYRQERLDSRRVHRELREAFFLENREVPILQKPSGLWPFIAPTGLELFVCSGYSRNKQKISLCDLRHLCERQAKNLFLVTHFIR